jgi:hypothetical protein
MSSNKEFWHWTLPWNNQEILIGLLFGEEVDILSPEGHYTSSLISIGLLFGRIDLLINMTKKEE